MSILGIKKIRKNYLIFSLFLIIFAIIYESFSHGVYSNYMMFAFLIPSILGFIMSYFEDILNTFYNCGVITLSVGSVMMGVLEIFGTTNSLVKIYPIVGVLLIIVGIISKTK